MESFFRANAARADLSDVRPNFLFFLMRDPCAGEAVGNPIIHEKFIAYLHVPI